MTRPMGRRPIYDGRRASTGSRSGLPARGAMGSTSEVVNGATPFDSASSCRMCDAFPTKNGLCETHLAEAQRARRADGSATRQVTDDDRAEIRRRYNRLESRVSIAKALGLTASQVRYALRTKP